MARTQIDISQLDGSLGFTIQGTQQDGALNGISVAGVGDVNGDGFDDVMVGLADIAKNNRINAGESYLVFGKASGFPATVTLPELDGTSSATFFGLQRLQQAGRLVTGAGDINADGIDDFVIAGNLLDAAFPQPGMYYVVYGSHGAAGQSHGLGAQIGGAGFTIVGAGSAYSAAAMAGDFNGDGIDDLIVSSGGNDPYVDTAYVLFGSPSGLPATVELTQLDPDAGLAISGPDFLKAVSGVGDVNGDGFDDVILRAPRYDANSYVIFGRSSGAAAIDVADLDGSNGFSIFDNAHSRNGWVSGAGDVNGDGFADVVIGSNLASPPGTTYAGAVYVVFGHSGEFQPTIETNHLDGSNGFRIFGADARDYAGISVSSAGDINGDGYDDLLIGARGAGSTGESYVVFGSAQGFPATVDLGDLDGSNGFMIKGIDGNENLGLSVAGAGDVNGDGFDDIIVAAQNADDALIWNGAAYVVFGRNFTGAVDAVGSAGDDEINSSAAGQTLFGAQGDDTLFGNGGGDSLNGGAGNDILGGGSGDDSLAGGSGDDELLGSGDNDRLEGNDGNDFIAGGGGTDQLSGGAGRDRFAFWAVSQSGFGAGDTITDFLSGADRIVLNGIAPGGVFVGEATFTAGGGIEARFDAAAGQLQVDVNDDGVFDAGDLEINGLTALAARDVLFV